MKDVAIIFGLLIGVALLAFVSNRSGIRLLSTPNGSLLPQVSRARDTNTQETKIDSIATTEDIAKELKKVDKEVVGLEKAVKKALDEATRSRFADVISISSISRSSSGNAQYEYVRLRIKKSSTPITITGWKLKSLATLREVTIGDGVTLPFLGTVNVKEPIAVVSNSTVYITTGHSPNGVSFQANLCTGFFSQFQSYYPNLSRTCPYPADNVPERSPHSFDDDCIDFLKRIPRCTLYTKSPPERLSAACQEYITQDLNYNSCINTHKYDKNFYKNEWRIFLGRDETLWKRKNEAVELLDTAGKVVDVYTY